MLSTSVSMAAYVYTYIGNNYTYLQTDHITDPSENIYDRSMHLELSFTTDSLLTNMAGDATSLVTSFSISEGIGMWTESTAFPGYHFIFNTDSSGNILQWSLSVSGNLRPPDDPATGVGNINTTMRSYYIIGSTIQDDARSNECINNPFGNCVFPCLMRARISTPVHGQFLQSPSPAQPGSSALAS